MALLMPSTGIYRSETEHHTLTIHSNVLTKSKKYILVMIAIKVLHTLKKYTYIYDQQ